MLDVPLTYAFSLLIIVSEIMNYRQKGAGASSAPKTLLSHYICPRDAAVVLPPRKLLLGFFPRECIFFPLPRQSLFLTNDSKAKPARAWQIFQFVSILQEGLCLGQVTEYQIQTVCAFMLVVPSPTLHQLYRQSLVLYRCLESPSEF